MTPQMVWRKETGYQLNGIVSGMVDGRVRLYLSGFRSVSGRRESAVFCISAEGETVWETRVTDPLEERLVSVFPNLIDDPFLGLCLFYSYGSSDNARPRPGYARLVRAESGDVVWEVRTRSHHAGNGSCIAADLDGDGRPEIAWWDSANVFCSDLRTGDLRWKYSDLVQICHGRPALARLRGSSAIIVGTEYSNPDGTSSVLALDGSGSVLWRKDGFPEDLGSTPVILADIDRDGRDEFVIAGLDLVHRDNRETSSLWCFRDDGELVYRVPCGCGGLAVARVRGELLAAGITNTRDGGNSGAREVRLFSLATGELKHSHPLPRAYLDAQNPVAADLDGDGLPDFLLATGNPSGYGNDPSFAPYADVHIVRADGATLWTQTFPDYIHQPFVSDVDGDGRNEMLLPCGDGSLCCIRTPGIATGSVWPCTGGSCSRWYGST